MVWIAMNLHVSRYMLGAYVGLCFLFNVQCYDWNIS